MTETGPGTLIVKWDDGTTSTYTIPEGNFETFSHTNNRIEFISFAEGQTSGSTSSFILNFDKMRGYERIGF